MNAFQKLLRSRFETFKSRAFLRRFAKQFLLRLLVPFWSNGKLKIDNKRRHDKGFLGYSQ